MPEKKAAAKKAAKKAPAKKALPKQESPPPEPEDGIQDHGEEIKPDRDKPLPEE